VISEAVDRAVGRVNGVRKRLLAAYRSRVRFWGVLYDVYILARQRVRYKVLLLPAFQRLVSRWDFYLTQRTLTAGEQYKCVNLLLRILT